MTTRWELFYQKQIADPKFKELVEREIDALQLGVQIARLRKKGKLSQTKLAALAEMSAPKISDLETSPRNVTVGTLIRVAHALGSRLEISFVPVAAREIEAVIAGLLSGRPRRRCRSKGSLSSPLSSAQTPPPDAGPSAKSPADVRTPRPRATIGDYQTPATPIPFCPLPHRATSRFAR